MTQDTEFQPYAGQLVAGGTNTNVPLIALEQSTDATAIQNMSLIRGLIPKISDVWIRPLKIFGNPFEGIVTRRDARYGIGTEIAEFVRGVKNAKNDCSCYPCGDMPLVADYALINYAENLSVCIKDQEVDRVVLNDSDRASYMVNKLRGIMQTAQEMRYRAWVQLISDVVDGTRSIASTTASDGTGDAVTYNPTVTGYAGVVGDAGFTLAPTAPGLEPTMTVDNAFTIYKKLKAALADMVYPSQAFNRLGVRTFTSGGAILVIERKILDAMDNLFAVCEGSGCYKLPSRTAREALAQLGNGLRIVEIDSFAALPTGTAGNGKRLVAVILEADAMVETVYYNSDEMSRCAGRRMDSYNHQFEAAFHIYKGSNSYALLAEV